MWNFSDAILNVLTEIVNSIVNLQLSYPTQKATSFAQISFKFQIQIDDHHLRKNSNYKIIHLEWVAEGKIIEKRH